MKSEDNFIDHITSSKSIFKNNLTTYKNLSSNKNIKFHNIQQDSYYLDGSFPENENGKFSKIKDELTSENVTKIDNILTKDNINSIKEINTESNNNLSKNESIKEILIQDEKESYKDKKITSQPNRDVDNIIEEDLKNEKELLNEFPFNFGVNKSSDSLIKNILTISADESRKTDRNNRHLNNNVHKNNKDEKINCWNFDLSPSKIFNTDNQRIQQSKNESNKLKDNNIHAKIFLNSLEDNSIIKDKEVTNLNEIFLKNEGFRLNSENIKINNERNLENEEYFDKNFINHNFKLFQNQNSYINFDYKINNKGSQNNYIQNNFINKNNKDINNLFEQKNLNTKNFNQINKNIFKEDIKDNKSNINTLYLNEELNEINQAHSHILNKNDNFKLYQNNKFIYYNNYINLNNFIQQNKNIEPNDEYDKTNNIDIPICKDKDNLKQENHLVTMFGKLGWVCRLCNNFNFKTRNICNRCKAIKTPKTKDEINEEREINKNNKKKIKEKKTDWLCLNCQNINYFFRKNCNRCNIERKKEFPPIYVEHRPKFKEKNNNIILTKNIILNKNLSNHINNNI